MRLMTGRAGAGSSRGASRLWDVSWPWGVSLAWEVSLASTVVRNAFLTVALTLALPLRAQERSKESPASGIPASAFPPAGLCRVWLRDVPAGQQPAATDCATAIRNRPNNAQVLFGEAVSAPSARTPNPLPVLPGRSALSRQADVPVRGSGAAARTFMPAGPSPMIGPGRGAEPTTGPRSSTIGTTGTPVRVPEPPVPTKVPDKPREIPQP